MIGFIMVVPVSDVLGDELGAFNKSSNVGFISLELMIFSLQGQPCKVATKIETPWLTPLLSAYHF